MELASAQCTPKCTFDSSKVNFDFKTESIDIDVTFIPYKPLNTSLSAADAISFASTDLIPTNAGTGGCPSSFKTSYYTLPGNQILGRFFEDTRFYNYSGTDWDFCVRWSKYHDNWFPDPYPWPILAVMLLIG